MPRIEPAVWFPTIRAGTGADVFTERLCTAIQARGIRAAITWLPHRSEYLPWTVRRARAPTWANIVHINTWLHHRFLTTDAPIVATMHHVVHDPNFSPYKTLPQALYHRTWIKPIERRVLARAKRISAVSRYTAQQLLHCFGVTDTVVIHNGVDLSHFKPPAMRDPHTPFRLLHVGSWSRRKGADLLPRIMEQLGAKFELRYTGDPRKLPTNCHALGRLDSNALARAYREADALLFPSRLEGFGQVAAEAMSCGLPVIASRNSAIPEVVQHMRTGWLVDGDGPEGFVDAIRSLRANELQWRQLSSTARHHAESCFDIGRMADAYLLLYEELMERDRCP